VTKKILKLKAAPSLESLTNLPLTLAVKLGSIAVHVDEFLSPHGHEFDKHALRTLIEDGEVKAWLQQMDALAMIPKKRTP
jgi:hypothetical protein